MPIAERAIQNAITKILDEEAGYENDPADRGGETNFGITQATADKLGVGDVKNLTIDTATDAYRKLFAQWGLLGMSDVNTFDLLVDCCTNHGPTNSIRWLQRALGIADADGIYGPVTQTAIDNATDWSIIFANILSARIVFYGRIVQQDATQIKFIAGWLVRATSFLRPWPKWQ
jgi:lysozyme family protein